MSALLNQVRDIMRTRRYSLQTEKTYIYWMKKYIHFHHVRHPKEMGADEVGAFLSHLTGVHWIMANLLYGAGLRLLEGLRLRVKDVDFEYQ